MDRKALIAASTALALAAGAGALWWSKEAPPPAPDAGEAAMAPGKLTARQIEKLGIATAVAAAASSAELGAVPATVSLPPDARVAVTAPFDGIAVRLFVVEGEAVVAGQPLASIRAAEPVQYGAALARAQAQLEVARAAAGRTGQLAKEGIVAGARADEARAALREAEVNVAENRRILAQANADGSGMMTLRAPIGGRIAAVNVQAGGPVGGLSAPFIVENTARLMLDLQIPERLAGAVHPGTPVEVRMPGTAPATGRVIAVGGSIDPATRALTAKARLDAAPALVSGKSVVAILGGVQPVAGASIPAAALTRVGDRDAVFVKGADGFALRPVTIASRVGASATITAGLKPGERVATSAIAELKAVLGGE